jgi:hypothetical protein
MTEQTMAEPVTQIEIDQRVYDLFFKKNLA